MAAPPVALSRGRRMLHASPSLTSLASSLSSLSLYTTTSSRTVWGPGALAGKAILALGKATVRGAERVVISRRMNVIQAHLPCMDESPGADPAIMDGLFDDLLELSRPELYPDSIRHAAMELILVQIASLQTIHLVKCLSRWYLDDLMLLIMEVMSVSMFCESGFLEPRWTNAYLSALQNCNPLVPAIVFLTEIVRQNETAFEAAVLSRFLDFLLLTASQIHLIIKHHDFDTEGGHALSSAFSALGASPLDELWISSLEQFWPFDHPPSLEDVVLHVNKTSPEIWLRIEAHFLQREALRMLEQATPPKYPMHTGRSVADVTYPQLHNFTLSSASTPGLSLQELLDAGFAASRALWHFICCVALGGDVLALTAEHLRYQSHRNKVSLFSRIIYLLIPDTRDWSSREMRDLRARIGGQDCLQTVLTRFLLNLAHDSACRHALLDAVITLLIPRLTPEMDPAAIHDDLYRRSNYFPSVKRPPTYSKRTRRLFGVIRENHLADVVGQSSRQIAGVLEPIFKAVCVQ